MRCKFAEENVVQTLAFKWDFTVRKSHIYTGGEKQQ